MNSSSYTQRQTPRLQNTSKAGFGNGLVGTGGAGWGGGLGGGLGYGANTSLGGGLGAAAQRSGQLSGFAQVMGGGGGGQGLDMSDFPSLSGGPRPVNQPPSTTPGGSLNYNSVRQTLGQPQQSGSQPQQQRAPSAAPSQQSLDGQIDGHSRSISGQQRPRQQEDFPALGGAGVRQATLNGADQHANSAITAPGSQNQAVLPIRDASNSAFQVPQQQQAPIGSGQQLQLANGGQAPTGASGSAGSGFKRYTDMTDREKFGLTGLLAAVDARQQRDSGHLENIDPTLPAAYRSSIFPGHVLDDLDLDLNSPEPLLPTFHVFGATNPNSSSLFDYTERMTVPDYNLPTAYQVQNVPAIEGRMDALSDETLFFIFFSQPRDVAQQRAAAELERRDWRWHKVLRQWLRRDGPQQNQQGSTNLAITDLAPVIPVGTASAPLGPTSERGVYIFFDAPNWRRVRRQFVLEHEELDHRDAGSLGATSANFSAGISRAGAPIGWTVGMNGVAGSGGMGSGGPVQPPTNTASSGHNASG